MIGSSMSEPAIHVSLDQIASPRARSAIRRLNPCLAHHSVKPDGAPGVRGQGEVGRVASRVEDRRRRVIDQDDHETASGSP